MASMTAPVTKPRETWTMEFWIARAVDIATVYGLETNWDGGVQLSSRVQWGSPSTVWA